MILSLRCCGSCGLKPESNRLITCPVLREVIGIWFSKDLKWNWPIDEITAKVFNCTLGFLKIHLQTYLSTLIKVKSYKGLVRFQVEYCWSVWDPRPGVKNNSSYKIERIQCCVVRWCLGWYKSNTSSLMISRTNMLEDQHGIHGMVYPTCRAMSDWQSAHGPL